MQKLAEQWLHAASIDVGAMERLMDVPNLTPAVAFHAQQAIEKSLKAVLAQKYAKTPKTHDLVMLYGNVRKIASVEIDIRLLGAINETYIETRYPTSPTTDELSIPSKKTAELFLQEARRIADRCRAFVLKQTDHDET